MSIRSILVPQNHISGLLNGIQGWFSGDESPMPYEMQTSRELVWVIRGELMSPDGKTEHEKALEQLRVIALEVMMPEIEAVLGERPQGPLSEMPVEMTNIALSDIELPDAELPSTDMSDA